MSIHPSRTWVLSLSTLALAASCAQAQVSSTQFLKNLSYLDLGKMTRPASGSWVVLKVAPQSDRPIIFQTGKVDKVAKTLTVVGKPSLPTILGHYKVLQNLVGQPLSPMGQYRWEQSKEVFSSGPETLQDKTFLAESTLICLLDAKKSGREKFANFSWIPPQWVGYAAPALAKINSGLQADTDIYDQNPFISIQACRELVTSSKSLDKLIEALPRVHGMKRASWILLLCQNSKVPVSHDDDSIDETDLFYNLVGLNVANVNTANDFTTGKPPSTFGPLLLKWSLDKAEALQPKTHDGRTAKILAMAIKKSQSRMSPKPNTAT